MAVISMDDAVRLAAAAGFPKKECATAGAVAKAESNLDTAAVNTRNRNGSVDRGLWQINSVHGYPEAQLMDPAGNARAAYEVWRKQGWRAWATHRSGLHLPHIADAFAASYRTGVATGKVGPGDLVTIAKGVAADPSKAVDVAVPSLAGTLDPLAALGKLAGSLADPTWWRRIGVGALGVALILVGLAFLGRDLITDTARNLVTGD